MDPAEFVTELKTRLNLSFSSEDSWCPLCDAALDTRGYHAALCCAGGDRTVRHNKLRNEVFKLAKTAGFGPVLEKAGLLLPASPEDEDPSRRRPADVYLPAWLNGCPAALDFAVTAPQRQDNLEQASKEALASAVNYADVKRRHLNTDQLCREAGIEFVPMVCETSGAWAPAAFLVLAHLASAAATNLGRKKEVVLAETLQLLSVTARRCHARAVLRRLA
eukprot:TRINITY_DN19100_c1_g1_i2.p2 TRINITY_DN19100_c1_g1~~TRINITY_DN19100_c1_g1_i2.p2  ORF type:complete len:220 (+),score=45.50 TRINITY_DN19100_c1_g1_i2:699-1358(+)